MAGFEVLTAVAVPIDIDNVDTDQIFPSRFTSKSRAGGMFGRYLLHDQRLDEHGRPRAGFVLNDERYSGAKILVAAANYACGSARPGAIYSHLDYGIEAIVAESFGPVFPTVAFKSGLLTVQLSKPDTADIRRALLAQPGAKVTVDLKDQVILAPDGTRYSFDIDPFVKRMFVEGHSEVDMTLALRDKIEAFETRQRASMPWLYQG
ncbi:MAG TPA: 3-isopropylmalate dehydratase small subunit [Casimicrobiaceae bacterium]|nr:3-isopropylmalate dehydratase small subunit [Casimicrobiaceae bacterium]